MSTVTKPPLSTRQPEQKRNFLGEVKKTGSGLPSRMVLHGVEGVGKTSFGASAPSPIFGMAKGETGLETLIDAGRVAAVDHFPEWQHWTDVLGSVEQLTTGEHNFKTFVIDTLNGVERLCHEFVCARDFGGKWGKDGFASYMQGYDVSCSEWRVLLNALDALREKRKMAIICLTHTKIAPFKNPEGADFDRYCPAMHAKTVELTNRWADMVLFANFFVETEKEGARHKGKGGQQRVLYTERHAAYDAKNRQGLAGEIDMGDTGKEAFGNFIAAIQEAKKGGE